MARDRVEGKRGRRRRGARIPQPAFATIAPSIMGSGKLRELPGAYLRVLLLAEANWTPNRKVILPWGHVATTLRISRTTSGKAINQLLDSELITLERQGKRPMRMGGAGKGQAALYDIEHRRKGGTLRLAQGDRRYRGFWKVWCADLRRLAAELGDAAVRVWVCTVIPCDRDHAGRPQSDAPFPLSGRELAKQLPGMAHRTAHRAIGELVKAGLIQKVEPASGCRSARYIRTGVTVTGIPRRRQKR